MDDGKIGGRRIKFDYDWMDARPDPDAVLKLLACSCVRFCRLCLHGKWPSMYRLVYIVGL